MTNNLIGHVDVNAESGEGILFKGASVPFGMIMWGPNNLTKPILGFSLTALSGAEMNDRWFDYISIRPTSLLLESFVGDLPRWPVHNIETGTMEEGSATPIVVNGYMFWACNFDIQAAWISMDKTESVPGALCQTTLAHPDLDL